MKFEPVLTDDGAAIKMQDGWPLVKTPDGNEVPWNIEKQAGALKDAEVEAKTRRLALEGLAGDLKLQVDIRKPDGLQALRDAVATVPTDSDELKRLRDLEAAGDLGDDAAAKIEAAAEKKSKERVDGVEIKLAKALRDGAGFKAQSDRDKAELTQAMTRQGVEAFYDRALSDKSGKLPNFQTNARQGFRMAVMTPENGNRWVWNGKRDAEGVPLIVQVDGNGEVVKGPDGIDPLSLTHYSNETLIKGHEYLYQPKEGATGVDGFGKPGAKTWGEQSQEDIDAAAHAQAAAVTGT